jgi:hypothetical protein
VTCWDAIDYCNWLSEKEGLPKAYDNSGNLLDKDGMITTDITKVLGYRLPTEPNGNTRPEVANTVRDTSIPGAITWIT